MEGYGALYKTYTFCEPPCIYNQKTRISLRYRILGKLFIDAHADSPVPEQESTPEPTTPEPTPEPVAPTPAAGMFEFLYNILS